jgi:hypothetical protein
MSITAVCAISFEVVDSCKEIEAAIAVFFPGRPFSEEWRR